MGLTNETQCSDTQCHDLGYAHREGDVFKCWYRLELTHFIFALASSTNFYYQRIISPQSILLSLQVVATLYLSHKQTEICHISLKQEMACCCPGMGCFSYHCDQQHDLKQIQEEMHCVSYTANHQSGDELVKNNIT